MAAMKESAYPWVADEPSDVGSSVSDFSDSEEGLELATSLLAALDALEAEDLGLPGSAKRKHDDDDLIADLHSQTEDPLQHRESFKRSRSMDKRDVGDDEQQRQQPESPLHGIPPEVALKILSCLSAAELALCGQVCKAFRDWTSVDTLWRRLYRFRWGQTTHCEGQLDGKTWKVCKGIGVCSNIRPVPCTLLVAMALGHCKARTTYLPSSKC
eukprot:evm.model.scf_733EXC.2 EVM.evm.TU.scf_733EXC.2   scf_733EXC:28153-29452(-)